MRRLLNLLVALDQFVFCVITLGDSDPDETMSAAAYRLELQGRLQGRIFRPLIDGLFFVWQKDHCAKAYRSERKRI